MAIFWIPIWILDLILVCLDFLLRPFWITALPMLAGDPTAPVPAATTIIFGASAALFALGAWLSRCSLRQVAASAWQGWNISAGLREERTGIQLPYDLDLLLPVLYHRRRAQAGKMSFHGRDTTAALGFSLVLCIVAAAAIVSFINGETNEIGGVWVWMTALALVAAAVSLGYAASSIGRAKDNQPNSAVWQRIAAAALMLPLIFCLLGVLGAITASLSLHLDSFPPAGFDIAVAIVARAVFLGVAAWLLVYPPRKIAGLTYRGAAISSLGFMALLVTGYAVWLTADWFLLLR